MIRLIVGFAPGGAVDIIARAIAQQIQGPLGQSVVVENRPGAGTNIAMRELIGSAPDGHTLMLTANSIAANPTLFQPAPFDPARDVTPVSLVGRVPVVIAANAASGPKSVGELISASRAAPGDVPKPVERVSCSGGSFYPPARACGLTRKPPKEPPG